MTKIFRPSFFRSKRANPLEEEEESLTAAVATAEYRDIEDSLGNAVGANGDEAAGSDGGGNGKPRAEDALLAAVVIAYFAFFLGLYYLLIGSFYLPPEAGAADSGRPIAIAGGVILAVAGPVLAIGLTVCCCCRSVRGPAAPPVVAG